MVWDCASLIIELRKEMDKVLNSFWIHNSYVENTRTQAEPSGDTVDGAAAEVMKIWKGKQTYIVTK